jgi:LPS O-antigen subunit length determinant protein (WzzB/FepE family)
MDFVITHILAFLIGLVVGCGVVVLGMRKKK